MRARRTMAGMAASLLLAGGVAPTAQGQEVNAPPTGRIYASLEPPYTHYRASVTDPDGEALSFEWSASISCGSWGLVAETAKMDWWHGEPGSGPLENPSGNDCTHSGVTQHEGTIIVAVSDGTDTVTCTYSGAQSGEGPDCSQPGRADLEVKLRAPAVIDRGTTGKFIVTITNNGPDTAKGTRGSLKIHREEDTGDIIERFSATPTQGSCKLEHFHTKVVQCKLGAIPAGGLAQVRVRVRTADEKGSLRLVGITYASTVDPDESNNRVTDSTRVR